MKEGEIGAIVVGLFLIAILVAVGLYLYQKSRYNEYSEGGKIMKIKVVNETPFSHIINLKDGTYLMTPGSELQLTMDRFDDISATSKRPDGEDVEFVHHLANDLVEKLYITLDGFRSNLSSTTDAKLINMSDHGVMFSIKSAKGDEVIPVQVVPGQSVIDKIYIPGRSTWVVSYLSGGEPVTEIKLGGGRIEGLVFDGMNLKAY